MIRPEHLQRALAGYLLSLEDVSINGSTLPLQNVSIITADADEAAGDLLTHDMVMKSLAGELPREGKFGLAVVIGRPVLENAQPNGALVVEDAKIILEAVEDKATNAAEDTGTGVKLDELRSALAVALQNWCHDGSHGLRYLSSDPIPEAALPANKRGWTLTFESKAHGHKAPARVLRPVITHTPPNMTISCATSGAAIWWTHDGSFPHPANAKAALYSTAVDVSEFPTGTPLKAAAFKAGLVTSDCAVLPL